MMTIVTKYALFVLTFRNSFSQRFTLLGAMSVVKCSLRLISSQWNFPSWGEIVLSTRGNVALKLNR